MKKAGRARPRSQSAFNSKETRSWLPHVPPRDAVDASRDIMARERNSKHAITMRLAHPPGGGIMSPKMHFSDNTLAT
jgi:hypothetical protein